MGFRQTGALVAILNKLTTSMHVDSSAVKEGFAGILTLGDLQGEFCCNSGPNCSLTVIKAVTSYSPELGLQIEAKPGCAQLFRGEEAETLHRPMDRQGPEQGVLVYADGEALRVRTYESVFKTAPFLPH